MPDRRDTLRTVLGGLWILSWIPATCAQGAELAARGLKANQASKRGVGSASSLRGSTLVYSVYVSDKDSYWAPSQVAAAQKKLERSFEFITRQAKRFGVKVSFQHLDPVQTHHDFAIPAGTLVDPLWTKQVIQRVSGSSGNELIMRLQRQYDVDNVVLCLHVNKAALSYNLAYYDNVDPDYHAERMVCYTHYPDRRETAAATYAHEILHVFGAGDLYFPYDKTKSRKSEARQRFPDDIMFRVDYDMSQLNVGPFTAYRVGWVERLKPELTVFED